MHLLRVLLSMGALLVGLRALVVMVRDRFDRTFPPANVPVRDVRDTNWP
jgi:hypothetical protein